VTRVSNVTAVFVERMPNVLEPGHLYISNEYFVTKHLCACGCGEVVTLPLHPEQWRYTFDGKRISVQPSVGNIGTPCNSHYWINAGHIDWAKSISKAQGQRGWERDQQAFLPRDEARSAPELAPTTRPRRRWWGRFRR
jgi:hypothetical protein